MGKWVKCLWVVLVAGSAVADDWYTWRGPDANGISAETGLNPAAAEVIWTKELGVGYSSACVKDGRLYTMGNTDDQDIVYCLDAKTGKEIWTYSYDCEPGKFKGPRATPVIDGDKLYTFSRDSLLICLDLAGKKQWEINLLEETGNKNLRWGVSSSPVIEGDLILLNIGDAGSAVNKKTGKVVWKSAGQQSYASAVVFDHKGKKAAAIFSGEELVIVEAATGKKVDSVPWKTSWDVNGADPLIIGDQIFVSSGYGTGCALFDYSSGKLKKLWENDLMKNQFSSCVYIDGYIYGVDGQTKKKGFLRCIDAKDGAEKWNMKIGFGSLIAADGKLIALGERGTLYFAESVPDGYKEIHQMETGLTQLCWTPPIIANGIVYCRNDKGTMVAAKVAE